MQNEPFEPDPKHSNASSNHYKGILTIRMQIRTSQKGFEAFKYKMNPSNEIRSNRMQILTIRKEFDAFEFKFEPFKPTSKDSNANSNHSKGIRMQIRTLQTIFRAF